MNWLEGSPFAAFGVALLVTLLVTPFVKRLGWQFGAVAKPDARRKHPEPIALWGGLGVFLGVMAAALLWREPMWHDFRLLAPSSAPADIAATANTLNLSVSFIGCGALIVLLGMWDDRVELSPAKKMLGQIAIVTLLWWSGVRVQTLPFSGGLVELSDVFSYALTLIWIIAMINAVNFIDGVDGLATGVCAIAAGCLAVVLWQSANWAAVVSAAICGACFGFLRYNFHPAKLFLGDTGSMLLGFWLAVIAIAAASKAAAATTLAVPVLVLGVPIADTVWAVVRRTIARQPFWHADRGHIHHRLLARGLSPIATVMVLYAATLVLGLGAIAWTWSSTSASAETLSQATDSLSASNTQPVAPAAP